MAIRAPNRAPNKAVDPKYRLKGLLLTFLERKPMTAELVATSMATRFVPLAVAGGSPKKIIKDRVNKEPPPAMVLTNPAKSPAPISKSIS